MSFKTDYSTSPLEGFGVLFLNDRMATRETHAEVLVRLGSTAVHNDGTPVFSLHFLVEDAAFIVVYSAGASSCHCPPECSSDSAAEPRTNSIVGAYTAVSGTLVAAGIQLAWCMTIVRYQTAIFFKREGVRALSQT